MASIPEADLEKLSPGTMANTELTQNAEKPTAHHDSSVSSTTVEPQTTSPDGIDMPETHSDLAKTSISDSQDQDAAMSGVKEPTPSTVKGSEDENDHDENVSAGQIVDDEQAFRQAAELNHNDPEAEWQFDSDMEVTPSDSSDSDSTSSDDEASNDDDFPLLTAEEQVRMLMEEIVSDEEAQGQKGAKSEKKFAAPKTQNEMDAPKIEFPTIEITTDMTLIPLGPVENIVETFVLIKGMDSAETQVLESGSVVCNADGKIIGQIDDEIGRVDNPYYTVAFNNVSEIAERNIDIGMKIYYVSELSTYVFTEPLRKLKGSDASNIHDEEVQGDDVAFSDDEEELAHNAQKKLDKEKRRNARIKTEPGETPAPDAGYTSVRIKREDEDEDELYSPIRRPDHLADPAFAPPMPPAFGNHRGGAHRGHDRGRSNRGRFDRGRGRGRYEGHNDRSVQNNVSNPGYQQFHPPTVTLPPMHWSNIPASTGQFQPPSTQPMSMMPTMPTMPTSHQMQYQQPFQLPPARPAMPGPFNQQAQFMPGAYVNPAFAQNRAFNGQQQAGAWVPPPPPPPSWPAPMMGWNPAPGPARSYNQAHKNRYK